MRETPFLERLYIDLPAARPGSPIAYILATLIVAGATLGRLAIDPWISGSELLLYFPVVMVTTFIYGVRTGSFAMALSTVAGFYYILPPRFAFQLTGIPELTALVVFALVASGDVLVVGLLRAALVRLSRLRRLDAALFDSNPDAIIVTDNEGRIVQFNRRTQTLFGYPPEALFGKPIELLIPEDLRIRHVVHRIAFAAAPQVREMGIGMELFARRANGETFPVDVQIGPVPPGGDARVIANVRDITEQKAANAALTESRQLQAVLEERQRGAETLSAIIESAPVAICAIDVDNRITMWNPALAAIYGISANAAIGRSWSEILVDRSPPDTYKIEELVRIARQQGGFHNIEIRRIAKDGAVREFSISAAPLHDSNNAVVAHLFIAHEITQPKELERKLRKAQKLEAIGQLTGGVAHDFNNLLAVIYGNLEAVKDEGELNPHSEQLIESSMRAAHHGAELTRRLLAFSRQQKLAPADVDVEALVVGTTEMLRRMVEESIDIVTTVQPDLWKSRIDAEQLANALVNLVINARDAMPDGGTLTIIAENATLDESFCENLKDLAPGPYVKLSVSDTGVGMMKEVLDRVLEPFFTTKPIGRGTGLGLSIVYGFINQSGGHMAIQSEAGLGTTVTLYLPKLEIETATMPPHEEERTLVAANGEVILLVEDDDTVRSLQVQSLQKLGYETLEARDGPSCLDIIRSSARVDLMLTDIVLPAGINGPALAEAARKIRPNLKVVFMSGYGPTDVLQRDDVTDARWLAKPFTRSELAQAVLAELQESKTT
ncbi:MAG: Blue-light-activated protein [Rhodospirillales bacterium]|nr:Blue-light-activated protein [Rhodospirillales bacterium]